MSLASAEAAVQQPWMKHFKCKPYNGDRNDALRFQKEFEEFSCLLEADDDWTVQDVIREEDEGGTAAGAPPLPQGANTLPRAQAKKRKRRKKAAAIFLMYMVDCENLRETLRAHIDDGAAMWRLWKSTQVESPTEATSESIKTIINSATILGTVGYNKGTFQALKSWLDAQNAKIQTVSDRVPEHQLAVRILDMTVKANVPYISGKAMEEFTAAPADRKYVQQNAGSANGPPAGARSVDRIVSWLGQLWDSSIDSGAIAQRPAGGKPGLGNTTRADGQMISLQSLPIDLSGTGGTIDHPRQLSAIYDEATMSAAQTTAFWENAPCEEAMASAVQEVMKLEPPHDRRSEKCCFNCFGFGHTAQHCPSPRFKRSLAALIQVLLAIQAKGGAGHIPAGGFTSPPSGQPNGRAGAIGRSKPKPFWQRRKDKTLRMTDDGTVYDEDNNVIGQLPRESTAEQPEQSTHSEPSVLGGLAAEMSTKMEAANAEALTDNGAGIGAAPVEQPTDQPATVAAANYNDPFNGFNPFIDDDDTQLPAAKISSIELVATESTEAVEKRLTPCCGAEWTSCHACMGSRCAACTDPAAAGPHVACTCPPQATSELPDLKVNMDDGAVYDDDGKEIGKAVQLYSNEHSWWTDNLTEIVRDDDTVDWQQLEAGAPGETQQDEGDTADAEISWRDNHSSDGIRESEEDSAEAEVYSTRPGARTPCCGGAWLQCHVCYGFTCQTCDKPAALAGRKACTCLFAAPAAGETHESDNRAADESPSATSDTPTVVTAPVVTTPVPADGGPADGGTSVPGKRPPRADSVPTAVTAPTPQDLRSRTTARGPSPPPCKTIAQALLWILTLGTANPSHAAAVCTTVRKPSSTVLEATRVATPSGPLLPQTIVDDSLFRARGFDVFNLHNMGSADTTHDKQWLPSSVPLFGAVMTVDSGADIHASYSLDDITHDLTYNPKVVVRVADDTPHLAFARGSSVQIVKRRQSGFKMCMSLTQMHVFPSIAPKPPRPGVGAKQGARLLGTRKAFENDGIETHLNGHNCLMLPGGPKGRKRRLPMLPHTSKHLIAAQPLPRSKPGLITDDINDDADLMQARLGYFSPRRIILGLRAEGSSYPTESAFGHDPAIVKAIATGGDVVKKYKHHGERAGYNTKRHSDAPDKKKKYTKFGERIGTDLCGPFPASITHGYRYAIVFYDFATGYAKSYYLKSIESQAVLAAFKQFVADHRKQLLPVGGAPLEFTSDNGNMMVSADMEEYCADVGTKHTLAIPWEPNTLHGTERCWGICLRPMRIMCAACTCGAQGSDPYQFWPFLMDQVFEIHCDLPSQHFDPPLAPSIAAGCHDGRKLMDKFKVMFCTCYVHLEEADRHTAGKSEHRRGQGNKLAPTAVEAVHIGWDSRRSGHRAYIPTLNRITTVRAIKCFERQFMSLPTTSAHFYYPDDEDMSGPAFEQMPPRKTPPARIISMPITAATPAPTGTNIPIVPAVPLNKLSVPNHYTIDDSAEMYFCYSASPTTDERWLYSASTEAGSIPIPRNEVEALDESNPYRERWREEMRKDHRKRLGNRAFSNEMSKEEAARRGIRVVPGRWVFAVVYGPDNSVIKFRARWVMLGYRMKHGHDYEDTYIGAVNPTSQRCMFALAAHLNKPIYECDITAAFTTAKMDRELYMEAPRGVGYAPGTVVRCDMAPEGGKASGNLYYVQHAKILCEKLHFERCESDPNIYRRQFPTGEWIIIGVLTDNCLILASGVETKNWFIEEYKKHYRITGGEEVTKFNGIEIQRDKSGAFSLYQKSYIERVHAKYLSGVNRPRSTPVDIGAEGHTKFMAQTGAQSQIDRDAMADKDYLGLIGCLAYISNQTRPDIQFHVSFLSQFMADPKMENYEAALNVLAYLYKTRHFALKYGGVGRPPIAPTAGIDPPLNEDSLAKLCNLHAWSDASYGTDKSHAGHVIMFVGAAIVWASRKIRVIALSTTEAETVGGVTACKDIIFVRNLLTFMWFKIDTPTPLLIDNEGMWFNVRNACVSARTRHWKLWQMFVRRCYEDLIITVHKVHTDDEVADITTKAFAKADEKYKRFRNFIMNTND